MLFPPHGHRRQAALGECLQPRRGSPVTPHLSSDQQFTRHECHLFATRGRCLLRYLSGLCLFLSRTNPASPTDQNFERSWSRSSRRRRRLSVSAPGSTGILSTVSAGKDAYQPWSDTTEQPPRDQILRLATGGLSHGRVPQIELPDALRRSARRAGAREGIRAGGRSLAVRRHRSFSFTKALVPDLAYDIKAKTPDGLVKDPKTPRIWRSRRLGPIWPKLNQAHRPGPEAARRYGIGGLERAGSRSAGQLTACGERTDGLPHCAK